MLGGFLDLENAAGGAAGIVAALGQGGHGAEGFGGVGRALVGVLFDEARNPAFEARRDIAPQLLHGKGNFLEMRIDELGDVFAVEGGMAGDGFVEDAAERVEIGPVIDGQALKLFRRHVVDGAHEGVEMVDGLGLRRIEIFGKAEVEDLDLEERGGGGAGDHEVARLEIAVDEAERVGRDDGFEALLREAEKVLVLEWAADEDVLERFAFDQFHDDIGALRVDAVVENRDDVGVLEAGGRHGFAPGLLDEAAVVLDDLHADALDGDGALEVMIHGAVNIAQTAAADEFPDFETVGDPALRGGIDGGAGLREYHFHELIRSDG
jgi:hypothetical protein